MGDAVTGIRASIFGLVEPDRGMPARELWADIARSVAAEFDDRYEYRAGWMYRLALRLRGEASPDKALVRFRTIEAGIRRRPGKPTLLDLSVGNVFTSSSPEHAEPAHVINDSRYAVWARHAGAVPLSEHVQLIEQFVEDVQDAGWLLERPALTPFQIYPPTVRNARVQCLLPTKGLGRLAQQPAVDVHEQARFVVVGAAAQTARRAAASLEQAFQRCFPGSVVRRATVSCSKRMDAAAFNLFLLDERADLGEEPDVRDVLRQAEADGCRFKLAKSGSLSKPYPAQNIAFDLFQIAGGRPWEPAGPQPAFCSIDAGHSTASRVSRWVKVECDARQCVHDVKALLTPLAEHMPTTCIDELWPLQDEALVCRDGRLSQERESLEARAARERRPLIEAKKSPKAIMWRSNGAEVSAAQFGDAVLDEHGDVLLQTAPQNIQDYIHAVRLSVKGGGAEQLATAFLHQHAMPGLSMFHISRLPGTLYLADLISKQTSDGWPKAIGRGFKLSSIVP